MSINDKQIVHCTVYERFTTLNSLSDEHKNTPLLSTAVSFFFPPVTEDRDTVEAVELELSLFFSPDPVETTLRTVADRFNVLGPCASVISIDVRRARAARTS